MANPEQHIPIHEVPRGEPHGGVGERSVRLPISPSHFDVETDELTAEAEALLAERLSGKGTTDEKGRKDADWFADLEKDIESGEKKAWYYPTVGKVVFVIAASAVATEMLRKGKDVRSLSAQIKKLRKRE